MNARRIISSLLAVPLFALSLVAGSAAPATADVSLVYVNMWPGYPAAWTVYSPAPGDPSSIVVSFRGLVPITPSCYYKFVGGSSSTPRSPEISTVFIGGVSVPVALLKDSFTVPALAAKDAIWRFRSWCTSAPTEYGNLAWTQAVDGSHRESYETNWFPWAFR